MTRSTSARDLATTSSIRPGWIRPSAMSFVRASRATSRRTGSKPERTTVSGVSSMIRSTPGRLLEGPDVAALAADDPALHLVGRQVDDRDRVLGGVVGGDALDRRDDRPRGPSSWASSRALRSIARASRTASFSASSRTASRSCAFASSAVIPEIRSRAVDLLGCGPGRAPRGSGRARAPSRGACGRAARACRCAGRAARRGCSRRRSRPDELGALGAGLVLGLALEAELLVLGLEDQLLLLGPGLGDDPGGLRPGRAHRLAGPEAAGQEADGKADRRRPRRRPPPRRRGCPWCALASRAAGARPRVCRGIGDRRSATAPRLPEPGRRGLAGWKVQCVPAACAAGLRVGYGRAAGRVKRSGAARRRASAAGRARLLAAGPAGRPSAQPWRDRLAADVRIEAVAGEEGVRLRAPLPRVRHPSERPGAARERAGRRRPRREAADRARRPRRARVGVVLVGADRGRLAGRQRGLDVRRRPRPCGAARRGARGAPRGRARSRDSTQARANASSSSMPSADEALDGALDEVRPVAGVGRGAGAPRPRTAAGPRGSAPPPRGRPPGRRRPPAGPARSAGVSRVPARARPAVGAAPATATRPLRSPRPGSRHVGHPGRGSGPRSRRRSSGFALEERPWPPRGPGRGASRRR